MEIRVRSGRLTEEAADALVIDVFEGESQPAGAGIDVDGVLGGAISQLIQHGDIKGKSGELTLVYTLGKLSTPRVVVLGLGKRESNSLESLRSVAGDCMRYLRNLGVGHVVAPVSSESAGQAIAEGALLGLYRFDLHKAPKPETTQIRSLTLLTQDESQAQACMRGVERGRILAEAANFARDMVNEPSNYMTPTDLASRAREAADEVGLECQILDREDMVELGMGALLGVAKGSHEEPKFIVLSYRGDPGTDRAIGLVGKGITFDSGGISIKQAEGMQEMKGDMAGGATVIGTLRGLGRLKPQINVTGIVPTTENMPGGSAIKPGDVLVAMNGTTIEVINTDAEGRLILADGLSYGRKLELSPLIDIATLTGAVSVALGDVAVGVMSNNDALVAELIAAGKEAGEKLWQLPLFKEYREQIESDVADIKNTGGRKAGSITAAWFLAEFVGDTPWAHLDMAGVDMYDRERGWIVKGASGIPVRTLLNYVLEQAARAGSARPVAAATADA